MTPIAHAGHAAAFVVASAAVLYTALAGCRALRVQGTARTLLAVVVLASAQIVLAVEVLSFVGRIGIVGLLALHLGAAVACAAAGLRPVVPPIVPAAHALARVTRPAALRLLAALVGVAAVVLLYLVLRVPPTTHDGLTYHMSRAALYLQQGSLAPFPTPDLRQTMFPANAEILILWQLALLRHDLTAGLVQFLSWLGLMLAVFGVAREAGLSPERAAFGALATGSLPLAVLQATSVQNDLTVACFTATALWFASRALAGSRTDALLAGLAWGLALGTKPTAVLALPGILLFLAAQWKHRRPPSWHPLLHLACGSVVGFVLLGSHFYVQNVSLYGSPSGPAAFRDLMSPRGHSVRVVWSNLGRLAFRMFDPSGTVVPDSRAAALITQAHERLQPPLFRALGIVEQLPDEDFMHVGWQRFPDLPPHEDVATFGPIFAALLLGAMSFGLLAPRSDARVRALSAGVVLYLVAMAVLFRYQHYHGRLLIGAMALGAPVLALVYREGNRARRSVGNLLLVAACAASLWASVLHNARKPLTGYFAVWRSSDRLTRMRLGRPHFEATIRLLDLLPPGRVGFVPVHIESFAYPLFGTHLDRPVTIVHVAHLKGGVTLAALPDVDYLLFTGTRQTFLAEGSPLPPPWPWFDGVDLAPVLAAIRQPGSGWRLAVDEAASSEDTVLLFVRSSTIGRGQIDRALRRTGRARRGGSELGR